MALPIVTAPNKVLTRPCRRVEKRELGEIRHLFEQMRETMHDIGVGLAAPQVGKPIRFFVAMNPETEEVRGYINPQIVAVSNETHVAREGCLSIPGWVANVQRHLAIVLKYQDLDFQEHEQRFDGFMARVLQHEFDHLNGVLLFERAIDGMIPEEDEPEEVGEDGELSPAAERRRRRRERLGSMQAQMQPVDQVEIEASPVPPPADATAHPPEPGA
jgi:peptide deformylase